ncbi:MAG: glycoside hydrolase family 13 protein [Clostridiales bacterium]|nr:glycoside hydrolase family 13 protein [Clostridiales bacterium]
MMILPSHNPYSEKYRRPGGAVVTGTVIEIRIKLPASYHVCEACLLLRREDAEITDSVISMAKESSRGGIDTYSCTFAVPSTSCLLWYCFSLRREGGYVYYYGRMEPSEEDKTITGGIYNKFPPMWQITVYENIPAPKWFFEGITYHIFADRFRRSGKTKNPCPVGLRNIHTDWYDIPTIDYDENGKRINCDFFGGNLRGIIESLDYLKSLSVTTIYLSPLFEAASNHRYDTADYTKIDPMLGDESDLRELCEKAHEMGMRVILDGVFSHTGSDSVYFNALGTFDSLGAAQSKDSPYYGWYDFYAWPHEYKCWWDVATLPSVNKENPEYLKFIVTGDDSVIKRWQRVGVDGWRLDVTDELPDMFLEPLYREAKKESPETMIIGEVWEDASNKISYGKRRFYLCGGKLDGVMNYPLRDSVIDFLKGGDAMDFMLKMREIEHNYPHEALLSSMSIIGTHDTARILTVLGDQELVKLAAVIQYTYPGSPTLYYGDEAGLEGGDDPLNRACYPWGRENSELLAHYRRLGEIRSSSEALKRGKIKYLEASGGVLRYERYTENESVRISINREKREATIALVI